MFYLLWPAVCVQEDPCMGVLSHVNANKGLSLPAHGVNMHETDSNSNSNSGCTILCM